MRGDRGYVIKIIVDHRLGMIPYSQLRSKASEYLLPMLEDFTDTFNRL